MTRQSYDPVGNWEIQLRKGVLEFVILLSLSEREQYGFELISGVAKRTAHRIGRHLDFGPGDWSTGWEFTRGVLLRPKETAGYTQLLRALADETRLRIVALLASAGESLCVCDVEARFDLTQPTISHHMKVLRESGIVKAEKRGTWVYYEVNRERVDALLRLHGVLHG